MKRIYFVVSDIHGHYQALKNALSKASFDESNPDHHLLVLGDLFDRGEESKEVFQYLYDLTTRKKASIIMGNHDLFLFELFDHNLVRVKFNINHNGFMKTIESFYGSQLDEDFDIEEVASRIQNQFPHLKSWIQSFPYWLEIGKYLFVHGSLDGDLIDFRETSKRDMVWGYESEKTPVKDRIVVCGHQRNACIKHPGLSKKEYQALPMDEHEIYYQEGKIFIDGFVEVSNKINVLVLDELE